ncbi:MAG: C-type lectin domain-containing protein [Myxococcales bacterium]|nr:C-type lectin domain-containing protein [Myxococcales bacterium]MCB9523986.1 C-type lectin domain-containing protein [Myxococcales bacterium]
MRAPWLLLPVALVGCSLSDALDRPYPGDPTVPGLDGGAQDGATPDATLDQTLADGAAPDGAPDQALPDGALDVAVPDMALPDTALPDATPEDMALPDLALPDMAPEPCDEAAIETRSCGPEARQAWRCDGGVWVEASACRAHLAYPCGAIQQALSGQGEWVDNALFVYQPNLAAPAGHFPTSGFQRMYCDGCQGDPFDQRLGLSHERSLREDGLATRMQRCDLATGACDATRYDYTDPAEIRLTVSQLGQPDHTDLYRIEGEQVVEGEVNVEGPADERYRTRYRYAADGWLLDSKVSIGGEERQTRVHRYQANGDWGVLEWIRVDEDVPFQRSIFDTTCAVCSDQGCQLDAPEGCHAIPLRNRDQFQGGWPTLACSVGAELTQVDAGRRCQAWGGTLAKADSLVDLRWIGHVAHTLTGAERAWISGQVDGGGTGHWDDIGEIPSAWFTNGRSAGSVALATASGGVLSLSGQPLSAYICEKRPE